MQAGSFQSGVRPPRGMLKKKDAEATVSLSVDQGLHPGTRHVTGVARQAASRTYKRSVEWHLTFLNLSLRIVPKLGLPEAETLKLQAVVTFLFVRIGLCAGDDCSRGLYG